ncbi:MAG: hypothetical protein M0Q95_15010 [Porticoccaceae bacterium]|nr:hypothetical protein [Porticoccaceae bacterium]
MSSSDQSFHDQLVPVGTADKPERFFDRFMFNMHPANATAPSVIMGFGHYPGRDVADGFALVSLPGEQRNVRFSTELSATNGDGAGPLRFKCLEPNKTWQLRLEANPTGMEYDITWHARTPYWLGVVEVENTGEIPTNFEHLVQSGRYEGTLTIDGQVFSVDGWYGQRDRSRGVRTMSGGQGLHIWYQAQFADRSVGFLLVESRSGERILIEGAVMHEDGTMDDIVNVRHALEFNDLDLTAGVVEVTTASGAVYVIDTDATAGGGFMAGGGYGGHHGKVRGRDYMAHEVYALDGSVTQRTVDTSLTDRLARFTWNGQTGYGIFEFALSRSSSYQYSPTLK